MAAKPAAHPHSRKQRPPQAPQLCGERGTAHTPLHQPRPTWRPLGFTSLLTSPLFRSHYLDEGSEGFALRPTPLPVCPGDRCLTVPLPTSPFPSTLPSPRSTPKCSGVRTAHLAGACPVGASHLPRPGFFLGSSSCGDPRVGAPRPCGQSQNKADSSLPSGRPHLVCPPPG